MVLRVNGGSHVDGFSSMTSHSPGDQTHVDLAHCGTVERHMLAYIGTVRSIPVVGSSL